MSSEPKRKKTKRISRKKSKVPPLQRTCKELQSETPDVTIVVGGEEFYEYRQVLCLASGYFDAAFRSEFSEALSKRFVFADKDPKEWELVASFFVPFSTAKISEDNFTALLPWFDELEITQGLRQCDEFVSKQVEKMTDVMDGFEACTSYDLPNSRELCVSRLRKDLRRRPSKFTLERLKLILPHMDHPDFESLWEVFITYIPDDVCQGKEIQEVIQNPMLPHLIKLKIDSAVPKVTTARSGVLGNLKIPKAPGIMTGKLCSTSSDDSDEFADLGGVFFREAAGRRRR